MAGFLLHASSHLVSHAGLHLMKHQMDHALHKMVEENPAFKRQREKDAERANRIKGIGWEIIGEYEKYK